MKLQHTAVAASLPDDNAVQSHIPPNPSQHTVSPHLSSANGGSFNARRPSATQQVTTTGGGGRNGRGATISQLTKRRKTISPAVSMLASSAPLQQQPTASAAAAVRSDLPSSAPLPSNAKRHTAATSRSSLANDGGNKSKANNKKKSAKKTVADDGGNGESAPSPSSFSPPSSCLRKASFPLLFVFLLLSLSAMNMRESFSAVSVRVGGSRSVVHNASNDSTAVPDDHLYHHYRVAAKARTWSHRTGSNRSSSSSSSSSSTVIGAASKPTAFVRPTSFLMTAPYHVSRIGRVRQEGDTEQQHHSEEDGGKEYFEGSASLTCPVDFLRAGSNQDSPFSLLPSANSFSPALSSPSTGNSIGTASKFVNASPPNASASPMVVIKEELLIVCIGDSITFGNGSSHSNNNTWRPAGEGNYPLELKALLARRREPSNEPNANVEGINYRDITDDREDEGHNSVQNATKDADHETEPSSQAAPEAKVLKSVLVYNFGQPTYSLSGNNKFRYADTDGFKAAKELIRLASEMTSAPPPMTMATTMGAGANVKKADSSGPMAAVDVTASSSSSFLHSFEELDTRGQFSVNPLSWSSTSASASSPKSTPQQQRGIRGMGVAATNGSNYSFPRIQLRRRVPSPTRRLGDGRVLTSETTTPTKENDLKVIARRSIIVLCQLGTNDGVTKVTAKKFASDYVKLVEKLLPPPPLMMATPTMPPTESSSAAVTSTPTTMPPSASSDVSSSLRIKFVLATPIPMFPLLKVISPPPPPGARRRKEPKYTVINAENTLLTVEKGHGKITTTSAFIASPFGRLGPFKIATTIREGVFLAALALKEKYVFTREQQQQLRSSSDDFTPPLSEADSGEGEEEKRDTSEPAQSAPPSNASQSAAGDSGELTVSPTPTKNVASNTTGGQANNSFPLLSIPLPRHYSLDFHFYDMFIDFMRFVAEADRYGGLAADVEEEKKSKTPTNETVTEGEGGKKPLRRRRIGSKLGLPATVVSKELNANQSQPQAPLSPPPSPSPIKVLPIVIRRLRQHLLRFEVPEPSSVSKNLTSPPPVVPPTDGEKNDRRDGGRREVAEAEEDEEERGLDPVKSRDLLMERLALPNVKGLPMLRHWRRRRSSAMENSNANSTAGTASSNTNSQSGDEAAQRSSESEGSGDGGGGGGGVNEAEALKNNDAAEVANALGVAGAADGSGGGNAAVAASTPPQAQETPQSAFKSDAPPLTTPPQQGVSREGGTEASNASSATTAPTPTPPPSPRATKVNRNLIRLHPDWMPWNEKSFALLLRDHLTPMQIAEIIPLSVHPNLKGHVEMARLYYNFLLCSGLLA